MDAFGNYNRAHELVSSFEASDSVTRIDMFNRKFIDEFMLPVILAHMTAKGALKIAFSKDAACSRHYYLPVFQSCSATLVRSLDSNGEFIPTRLRTFIQDSGGMRITGGTLAGFDPDTFKDGDFLKIGLGKVLDDDVERLRRVTRVKKKMREGANNTMIISFEQSTNTVESSLWRCGDSEHQYNRTRSDAIGQIYENDERPKKVKAEKVCMSYIHAFNYK